MKRPNETVRITPQEAQLIRALLSDERHKQAVALIFNQFCRFNMVDFFTEAEGGDSANAFSSGRRFVANQLLVYGTPEVGEKIERVNEAKEATK